jgi:hypothetical protein
MLEFHQALLRREEDEKDSPMGAGQAVGENASLVTEGFVRTDACVSSSSARRAIFT